MQVFTATDAAGTGEMPTAFEIIDMPGLDELRVLPEIKQVVQDVLDEAQARLFVVDGDTDAVRCIVLPPSPSGDSPGDDADASAEGQTT